GREVALRSSLASPILPLKIGTLLKKPEHFVVYIAARIVAQIQDDRFLIIFLLCHIYKKAIQFAPAHVFHMGVSDAVVAPRIYFVPIFLYPFVIKQLFETAAALRTNVHIMLFPIPCNGELDFRGE